MSYSEYKKLRRGNAGVYQSRERGDSDAHVNRSFKRLCDESSRILWPVPSPEFSESLSLIWPLRERVAGSDRS